MGAVSTDFGGVEKRVLGEGIHDPLAGHIIDGNIYGITKTGLYIINKETLELTSIRNDFTKLSGILVEDSSKNKLFFMENNNLFSYK